MLRFEKIASKYYSKYMEMLTEWKNYDTSLSPDVLELPCANEYEYKTIVLVAEDAENGIHNYKDWYEKCYYYLVLNDQDRLLGAVAIRTNLTQYGKDFLGNISYGIRPSERRKGYGKAVANMVINKCKEMGMNEIIVCHDVEDGASRRILESAGAIPMGVLLPETFGKKIYRYIIKTNINEDINLDKAIETFKEYIKPFDKNDGAIYLKVIHTYHVMQFSENIAQELKLKDQEINLAKLIALLHDIGRFEQYTAIKTDPSKKDINHAEYGIKVLLENSLIRKFIATDKYDEIIKKAILNHNKYKIEEGLSEKEKLQCEILRDADKLDNFRIREEEKIENFLPGVQDVIKKLTTENISDKVYEDFLKHKCIKLEDRKTVIDYWICVLAFIFDLKFKSSIKYVLEKDYITKLIDRIPYKNEDTKKKMEEIKKCANEYLKEREE